ncbi:hypothetical protein PR202_gb20387 [Eleusine coracana subsp. coracana]|uniref:protein-serine/threonine phosphatase n=1 Tax=Eleusine coracana subsp. coracana TaxID=191504 RepID=A0AAV5FB89_ELECO|nr:hypothetical protein PR202_gb20387 [Eleusine coracana subsp. coracana]
MSGSRPGRVDRPSGQPVGLHKPNLSYPAKRPQRPQPSAPFILDPTADPTRRAFDDPLVSYTTIIASTTTVITVTTIIHFHRFFFIIPPTTRAPPFREGLAKMMMTRASMGAMEGAAVDEVVRRLVEGGRAGRQVQLSEAEIRQLCVEAKRVLLSQPNLLRIHAPVKICGETSLRSSAPALPITAGAFFVLSGPVVDECAFLAFLGAADCAGIIVDCRCWVAIRSVVIIRGKSLIDDKVLCMHGGLSPELNSLDQINDIERPTEIPDEDKLVEFLEKNDLDLVCRAHQVVEDGYEFFAQRRLVTIFSAPNYCGEFDNVGALLSIDESLMCSFQILKPNETGAPRSKRPIPNKVNDALTSPK